VSYSAEKIKEDYTYVCQDIVKEFKKYDTDPYKYFARFSGEHSVTGRVSLSSLCCILGRTYREGEEEIADRGGRRRIALLYFCCLLREEYGAGHVAESLEWCNAIRADGDIPAPAL
jgi:hypothetical protein